MLRELTLPMAYELAEHLCPQHRRDVLQRYSSVWTWARSRVELPGLAWGYVRERVMLAGGVVMREGVGVLWLAGREGWERYAKHALKVWGAMRASGACRSYFLEVTEGFSAGDKLAEHMGFRRVGARGGLVIYGAMP